MRFAPLPAPSVGMVVAAIEDPGLEPMRWMGMTTPVLLSLLLRLRGRWIVRARARLLLKRFEEKDETRWWMLLLAPLLLLLLCEEPWTGDEG